MKKKIFEIILTTLLIFIGINNVGAGIGGSGDFTPPSWQDYLNLPGNNVLAGRTLSESEMCEYGGYSGLKLGGITMNAVRMTIVDRQSGARISKSVDFYSGSLPTGFNSYTYVGTGNKTRNEIISSGTGYIVSGSRPSINYWTNLPAFVENGGGSTLKNYFISKYSSEDLMDMVWIFGLMNYEGYKDARIYENHALLVEPIFQFHVMTPTGDDGCRKVEMLSRNDYQHFTNWYSNSYLKTCDMNCSSCANKCKTWDVLLLQAQERADYRPGMWGAKLGTETFEFCDCQLSTRYYYGTATEIFSMMKQTNDRILTYKIVPTDQGGSGKTIISNIGSIVHDDRDVGGLYNASGVANPSEAYKHILDNYGLGSMHIWMDEIMQNYCIDSNGVRWEFEDNWSVEQRQAYIDEHCPSPTEPSDEYCPTNSDHPEKMIPADKVGNETQKQQWIQENCYDNCANITSKIKSYDDGVINDCNNSNTINTFEDTDRWDCIYETINYATADTYAYEFYHPNGDTTYDNNPYCSIACRESISVSLPKEFEVVAGGRFTIGASNEYNIPSVQPNQIVGKTECFTAYPQRGVNVAGINLEQFKIDYKNADDAVAVAWDNYQIEVAKQKSKDDVISISEEKYGGDHNCKDTTTQTYMTNEDAVRACHQLYFDMGIADASPCNAAAQYDTRTVGVPRENCPAGHFEHDGNPTWTYKTYTGRTYYYKNQPYQVTYDKSSDGQHDSIPNFDVDAKKRAYEQALAVRDGIFNKLMECNNFQRTFSEFEPKVSFAYSETKYRLESNQLAMIMNPITSESRYMVNNLMVGGSVQWNSAEYTNSSRTYIQNYTDLHGSISNDIHKYICNTELAVCSDDALTYPSNTSVGQFTTKVYEYELPENIYRYISKKDGISFNTYNEASLVNYPYDDVIDTGHSNLPISYETRPGYYNYFIDYYYAGGVPNLFGTNQKFYKYNQILPGSQSSFGGLTLANNLYYHCRYKVKCGLTEPCPDYCEACDGSIYPAGSSECNKACPPPGNKTCTDPCTGEAKEIPDGQKASDVCPIDCTNRCPDGSIKPPNGVCACTNCGGIRIIYRPISLNDPFPGEHGNGRPSGANWVGETTVLGTTRSFIDAYITNNRGVTTEEVYKETPMYEFTLNASNIRAIRRYNNSKRDDYNDYDLNCINGKYCKSEFLEKGLASGYFNFSTEVPTGGTCLNAYSTNWESCRYSNIGG